MLFLIASCLVFAVLAKERFLTAGEEISSIDPFGWTLILLVKEDSCLFAEELLSSNFSATGSSLESPLTVFLEGEIGVGLAGPSFLEELIVGIFTFLRCCHSFSYEPAVQTLELCQSYPN